MHAPFQLRTAVARRGWLARAAMLSPTARGALFVLGAALAFSTLGSLSGFAYRAGMGSATFVTLRAIVGTLLLIGFVGLRGRGWVRLRGLPIHERAMLGAAVVANATLNLALFAAYGQMAVALVLAVYFTYPMLVAIASVVIGRERFTLTRATGLGLAVAGLGLVMVDQVGGGALTGLGVAWALVAA